MKITIFSTQFNLSDWYCRVLREAAMVNLPDQHQQTDDRRPTTKQNILLKPTMIVEAPLPQWRLTMSTTTGDDSHRNHDHTQDLQNYVIIQMVRSSGQRPPLRPKPCHHHWQFLLVGWSTTLVLNLVIRHHRRCFRSHPQVGWWWIKKMKKLYLVMVLAHRWQVSSKWCWMFRHDRIVDAPVLSLFSWNMHSINCHLFIHPSLSYILRLPICILPIDHFAELVLLRLLKKISIFWHIFCIIHCLYCDSEYRLR